MSGLVGNESKAQLRLSIVKPGIDLMAVLPDLSNLREFTFLVFESPKMIVVVEPTGGKRKWGAVGGERLLTASWLEGPGPAVSDSFPLSSLSEKSDITTLSCLEFECGMVGESFFTEIIVFLGMRLGGLGNGVLFSSSF